MATPTIRELITQKSLELRDIDSLGPHQASEELVTLSSLLSTLNKHIVDCHAWYNIKAQQLLVEHQKAAIAKIHAEASPEWKSWQEAKQQGEALKELIRAVKYYLRMAEEEQKEFTH